MEFNYIIPPVYGDNNNIHGENNTLKGNSITLWHLGYRFLVDLMDPLINKVILDYGCGNGVFCRFINQNSAKVTGVDVSRKMINVAKENYPDKISYSHIASGVLDFLKEDTFDYVVSNFVFCKISTGEEIIKIMKSIVRILKKTGSLIILNHNWDKSNGKEFISFKLPFCRKLYSGKTVRAIMRDEAQIFTQDYYWSKADYFDFLTESGFEIQGINEPLATGNEIPWVEEKSFPPYVIIHVKKSLS
jgi:ubiquinone/menaquinone biosynthesis C-methylase UbiE